MLKKGEKTSQINIPEVEEENMPHIKQIVIQYSPKAPVIFGFYELRLRFANIDYLRENESSQRVQPVTLFSAAVQNLNLKRPDLTDNKNIVIVITKSILLISFTDFTYDAVTITNDDVETASLLYRGSKINFES